MELVFDSQGFGSDPATCAKFKKVTNGMPLNAIAKLLGKPKPHKKPDLWKGYYWWGPQNARVFVSFFKGSADFIRYDPPPKTTPTTRIKVTRAQCAPLKPGMTYQQVTAKLGCPGVQDYPPGLFYQWKINNVSLQVYFTAGTVTSISRSPSGDYKRCKYDAIALGMTLAEVRKILGANGALLSDSGDNYYWDNVDGSRFYACFRGGKLTNCKYHTKAEDAQ
jgi:outer membrane protein assembly factor BamE (lipoprotein component of BamABCDE complex)